MKTYETSATVEHQGRIQIAGVPFAEGTQVQVTISPKRLSAEEFTHAWRNLCAELRSRPSLQGVSGEDFRSEIDRYRAGQ